MRGVSGSARDRLRVRVESHRAELKRLTQEFDLSKNSKNDVIDLGIEESWDNGISEDQRKRLLDASERIDRTGRTLQNGYRMVLETEEIGTQVLKDLHDQRETIQRSRGRVNFLTSTFCKFHQNYNFFLQEIVEKILFYLLSSYSAFLKRNFEF